MKISSNTQYLKAVDKHLINEIYVLLLRRQTVTKTASV